MSFVALTPKEQSLLSVEDYPDNKFHKDRQLHQVVFAGLVQDGKGSPVKYYNLAR